MDETLRRMAELTQDWQFESADAAGQHNPQAAMR
jgi:hypothetical protein